MKRLLIHVEGETEESFTREVLQPHLLNFGYAYVSARLIGNSRQRFRRGGIRGWNTVRGDIIRHLREDKECLATTMVDYYGLPQSDQKAWPRRIEATQLAFQQKAEKVESSIFHDIQQSLNDSRDSNRFIPFVMMHEFESLLFSDCEKFSRAINQPSLIGEFQDIRSQFNTPEEINDSPETAPSKRVEKLFKGYNKPLLGTLAALAIGLDTIRREYPHFNQWLGKLECWLTIK